MIPAKRLHRHGDPCEAATASAELWLWAAVLADALEILHGRGLDHGAVAQAHVRQWLFETSGGEVGSFAWVCEVLGLDAPAVRRALDGHGH